MFSQYYMGTVTLTLVCLETNFIPKMADGI